MTNQRSPVCVLSMRIFFFSSRRRHTRLQGDWSSDVCSSDLGGGFVLTPLLHLVFKIPMPIAVGSALCQKIGTSIGSFLKHRQYQHGELRVDKIGRASCRERV